jgi:hypothetical protein
MNVGHFGAVTQETPLVRSELGACARLRPALTRKVSTKISRAWSRCSSDQWPSVQTNPRRQRPRQGELELDMDRKVRDHRTFDDPVALRRAQGLSARIVTGNTSPVKASPRQDPSSRACRTPGPRWRARNN